MGNFIGGMCVGGIAVGTLVWIFRDPILLWYKGAEDRVGELNDMIRRIKGK